MFDSNMFVSGFWSWFIIILTGLGIASMFWLITWQNKAHQAPPPGEEVKTMGHVWDENLEELNNPLPMWWLNMFYITLFFGIIYLILFPGMGSFKGILGWTSTLQYEKEVSAAETRYSPLYAKFASQPLNDLANNKEALAIGERLFLTYCTSCHGTDARGNIGFPNLRDSDWLWGGSPEAIKKTIMSGRQAMMPNAQTNGLKSEDDIKNVVQYVISLSAPATNRPFDAAAAEQGKAIYGRICVACHGPEGKGNPMLGAPNLTDKVWLYGSSQATLEETVRKGRQGKMPAFGEFLGNDKVHLLAAYINSLALQAKDK